MLENGSRRGAADMGLPLMVVAFVAIGGFMYWLNGEAAAERALELVEDTTTEVSTDVAGAITVDPVDIQLDASPFEGQMIRIEGLRVASMLGTQGFWLEMPNRNPFLVSMSAEVMAEGVTVSQGQAAAVTGVVIAVNDSILDAWTESGTIGDGDRLAAEFATHFVEAELVQVAGGGADGAGN